MLLLGLFSFQSNNYKHIKSIPLEGTLFSTDKFGNAYVVSNKYDLQMITPKGLKWYNYNNNRLGPINFVGTNNPLKILLFYHDFATLVTLDRTLSQTSAINLYEMGMNQVSAACVALDNNIWIYDEVNFKLLKIDDQLNIVTQSEDLNVLFGESVRVSFMIEQDNFIYANDPDKGILVFDIFGTYYKTIPIKGLKSYQKIQDQLIYFHNGRLIKYNLNTFKETIISLPENGEISQVRVEKNLLYLLKKNQLDLYSY